MSHPNQRRFMEIAKGVALVNKGAIFHGLGQEKEAEALWEERIRINVRPGFAKEHTELMRIHLANYYIDNRRM